MPSPFLLPQDVVEFIDKAFRRCNTRVANRLSRLPTIHETYLDLCVIETLADVATPHITPSGYIVDIDVHFLGQGRHWGSWEIADIGLILVYRHNGRRVRTKIALLQSKRLYPREAEFIEDEPLSKYYGFGDLYGPTVLPAEAARVFHFSDACRYRALQVGDDQWRAIANYENDYRIPVHYLLYHPRAIPSSQVIPAAATGPFRDIRPTVGCRVVASSDLRTSMAGRPRNYAPSYGELVRALSQAPNDDVSTRTAGWRLEGFVSDQVLGCHEGYVAAEDTDQPDQGLVRVFTQRGAPIVAALRIDINAPDQVRLEEAP